jgi:hypothetical protein
MFSAGTFTSSSAISHGSSPITVGVLRTTFTPGVSLSTRNMLKPPRLPLLRSVAATSWRKSASAAPVIQRL